MLLALVAVAGTAVVFCAGSFDTTGGDQLFRPGAGGHVHGFPAPDVALSQVVVGTVGLPLMILLALAKMRRDAQLRENAGRKGRTEGSAP